MIAAISPADSNYE